MRWHRRGGHVVRLLWILVSLLGAAPAHASALPAPSGPVLLTVRGDITRHNLPQGGAAFDRAALEALGLERLRTSSAFTDGVSTFEGVPLCRLLDHVGARGTTLLAHALNDYSVEIPIADCRRYPVLLALRRDGVELSLRDKGPIWVVYPRDQHPELRSEQINSRWIWQLDRLEVR